MLDANAARSLRHYYSVNQLLSEKIKIQKSTSKKLTTGNRPILVVTKYMGSKKAILDFVVDELERLTEPGDILVDLMAGTHTIGYAMKKKCIVVANDIQKFSRVIGTTLMNYIPKPRFEGELQSVFRRFFVTNLRNVERLFAEGMHREASMLSTDPEIRPNWETYHSFCEGYPHFVRQTPVLDWSEDHLMLFSKPRVNAYRSLNKLEPYSLFSLYYANAYIGVQQAAEIDSLRYAVDKLCDEWLPSQPKYEELDVYGVRCLLLSGLMAVLNRINPGPGHWAAIPRINQRNQTYISAYRRIDLYPLFLNKIAEFENALADNASPYAAENIAMTEDYESFMDEVQEYIRSAKVVYLDPPYSQGHYSRFYHLLETLVQYDYPDIAFAGRYRTDRHQSPFSKKDTVTGAIGHVCEMVRDAKTTLVISYSQGGIIPDEEQFRKILEKYYPKKKIELRTLSAAHSKFGQAERMQTKEYMFTCHP